MNINFESKQWAYFVRVIMVLLAIIQSGFIYWARYITTEVLDAQKEMATQKSDIAHVREDVSYIRNRLDKFIDTK